MVTAEIKALGESEDKTVGHALQKYAIFEKATWRKQIMKGIYKKSHLECVFN